MNTPAKSLAVILLLWAAGLGAAGQFAKIAVPFAEIRAVLPPDANVGWLLSIISLVGAVFGAVAGALITRLGLERMLILGLVAGGAMSLWQAVLPAFGPFLASRIIEGISHLAIVIAAPTLIAQIARPRYRGAAMALWSTFFGACFALVGWFGLPFVSLHGIKPLFMIHGGYMAVLAVVLAVTLPKPVRASHSTQGPADIWRSLRLACASPFIAAPGAGWLFYTLTFVALLAILPDRLPPDIRAPLSASLPLISTCVALIGVPVLLRITSAHALTMIGFALSCLAVALFRDGALGLLCLILFTSLGLVQGAGFALVPELNDGDNDRALAYGLMAQTGNLGNLAGTPLLLVLLDHGGDRTLLTGVAAIYGVAVLTLGILGRLRRHPFAADS